jgi:hypothetical protein
MDALPFLPFVEKSDPVSKVNTCAIPSDSHSVAVVDAFNLADYHHGKPMVIPSLLILLGCGITIHDCIEYIHGRNTGLECFKCNYFTVITWDINTKVNSGITLHCLTCKPNPLIYTATQKNYHMITFSYQNLIFSSSWLVIVHQRML